MAYFLDLGGLRPPAPRHAEPAADLTDPAEVRRLLSHAGLAVGPARTLSCPWEYPDLTTALRGLLSTGPATTAISYAGLERVVETITGSISPYRRRDGSYLLHNTCFTVVATLP